MGNCLFLQDRIVSVIHQPGAHAFSVFGVSEWPDLYVKEFVGRRIQNESRILPRFQCLHQSICIFLLAHRCYLDEVPAAGGNRLWRCLITG